MVMRVVLFRVGMDAVLTCSVFFVCGSVSELRVGEQKEREDISLELVTVG